MDLLEIPLPDISLTLDVEYSLFFERCERIAADCGWRIDRRSDHAAGFGYDQLNLHISSEFSERPMLRMFFDPKAPKRLGLDVVARWSRRPIDYDEYLNSVREGFSVLLAAYYEAHGKRFRLGVPRRPPTNDPADLDGRVPYAAEKFGGLTRSLAIGKGDARERLKNAFYSFHTVKPEDLPAPLNKHLAWVYSQITKRPARSRHEGTVSATVSSMKNATAARVLERLVDLAVAIERLDRMAATPGIPTD